MEITQEGDKREAVTVVVFVLDELAMNVFNFKFTESMEEICRGCPALV